eukprot:m.96273 g.96273  ORF g.96273 m.96273 type:complete len:493 (+) comp8626_c0_seq4:70-1548(+)
MQDDETVFVGNVQSVAPRRRPGPMQRGDLIFNAHFESGNLSRVEQIDEVEFDLYIRSDTQNPKQRIWFHFTVRNTAIGQRAIFNFVNYSKSKSLYRHGMTPLVRSTSRPQWQRIPPQNLFYYKTGKKSSQFSLAFLFDNEEDTYHFAYCYPYTYSRLQDTLGEFDGRGLLFYSRALLGLSDQQRRLDLLTIYDGPALSEGLRSVVFITARIHPGESPSSFVCQGLIEFLLGSSPDAEYLRRRVVFKIIPMLNPDGVYHGNYRCSTLGYDLNRCWANPSEHQHSTIYRTRRYLEELVQDPTLSLDFYIDLHAHSSSFNAFMFGNLFDDASRNEEQWALPRLLAAETRDFSVAQTLFNNDKQKAGTGRRSLGGLLGNNTQCYTLEVSFFASKAGDEPYAPFAEADYERLGGPLVSFLLSCFLLLCRPLVLDTRPLALPRTCKSLPVPHGLAGHDRSMPSITQPPSHAAVPGWMRTANAKSALLNLCCLSSQSSN